MSEWIETRFPGYFVNSEGQVKGRSGRILRPGRTGKNLSYLVVFCGRKNPQLVHRLVAEAFLGSCPEGHEVAHADGNGFNNTRSNLSYKTKAENEQDKILHGTFNHAVMLGESNGRSKLTEQDVREIRLRPSPHNKSALAREFGVSRPVIAGVLDRTLWKEVA